MSNLVLIPENILALRDANVIAASEASASMADDNLLTEEPSQFWRSTKNSNVKTFQLYGVGSYLDSKAAGIGFFGHNLYRGDQCRIVLIDGAINPSNNVLLPDAIVASTNRTGAVTVIDEGESPGGDFMTPTAGSNWDVHVSFQTPSNTLKTGEDLQAFWAFIKLETLVPSSLNAATVKCELYEGSVLIEDLGTKILNSTDVIGYCWKWDASLLASAAGASLECKLTFTSTGSATYAPKLDSLCLVYDRTNDLWNTSQVYTSPWHTFEPFEGDGITRYAETPGNGSSWFLPFGASYTFKRCYVLFRCDRAPIALDVTNETPPDQPGYLQIGSVTMGETWSPSCDRDFGPLVSTKDYSSKSRTYGGQRFGSRRFVQRILSLPLNWLTPAEAHTLFDRILWRQGILKPILISILPGDATEETHTTFLASLKNPENAMVATSTRGKSRAMTLEFEEEL